jgi:hypothetical protein
MSLDGLLATMSLVGSINPDVCLCDSQELLIAQRWVGALVVLAN